MNIMDNLNLKITFVWIIFGTVLLVINFYTKKAILKVIGITAIVTSISSFVITTFSSLFPKYIYLNIILQVILGVVIFFGLKKITKINQIGKINSPDKNEVSEEA